MTSNWQLFVQPLDREHLWAWPRQMNFAPGAINAVLPVYRWAWKAKLPERKGSLCVVTARGKMNSVRVEFLEDGAQVITSRYAIRRARSLPVPPTLTEAL